MKEKLTITFLGSRLRNKFILSFVLLSSLPPLILGSVSLYLIDLSHRYDVSNLEVQLLDQKTEEIKKFFADTLGILELRVGFDQKSEIELSQQNFILEGLLEENRAFEEVSFINLQGRESVKKNRTSFPTELEDLSRMTKFLEAREGRDFRGGVYYTLIGPFITLASPVRNRNGDVIQVLSAEVNLSQISRLIETARLGSSGYLALLDKDGALISHHAPGKKTLGLNLVKFSRVERVLKGEIFDGSRPEDRYESFWGRVAVAGAGKKISDLGWVIIAEWPLSDADAIVRDVRNQVILLTIFSVLAVLILAPFFAARLTKPLRILEAGAVEIEKGNFEKRVAIKTGDELEDLGEAFNRMAQGLKRLQELKNEFVFIAAHELRTPVTAIKGYLSLLFEGSAGVLPEKVKKYLDPVWQSNERLIGLINNILEVARSEAGRLKIAVAPHDIRETIKSVLTEIEPIAAGKKISISYNESQNLSQVFVDPLRLGEVITNLVSNAIKYNRAGGLVKIYHETESSSVITHVEDNGLGMSEEDQKHVFEKFFRSAEGEARLIQGTGLGLFITKELVEKMGGKVWFESKEGEGTRFSFSLPTA